MNRFRKKINLLTFLLFASIDQEHIFAAKTFRTSLTGPSTCMQHVLKALKHRTAHHLMSDINHHTSHINLIDFMV
jgi:hypothetical protein